METPGMAGKGDGGLGINRGSRRDTSRAPGVFFLLFIITRLTTRTATISTMNDSDWGSSLEPQPHVSYMYALLCSFTDAYDYHRYHYHQLEHHTGDSDGHPPR